MPALVNSRVGSPAGTCCDGTGNQFGDDNSNVVKLYATLDINDKQIGYYHPGVGTMGAPAARNKVEEEWSVLTGLAFGAGFMLNVGDAYRYLMNMYREGDDIYLFGFSRGAYTVRALARRAAHVRTAVSRVTMALFPYVTRMLAQASKNLAKHQDTFDICRGIQADIFARCHIALRRRVGHGELRGVGL